MARGWHLDALRGAEDAHKKRHRPFTYHVSVVAPMNNEPSVIEFTSGTWKALWLSMRRKSRNHGTQPVGHSTTWKHSWGSWQWISGPGAYGDATSNDMSGLTAQSLWRLWPPSPGKSTTTQTPRPTIEGTPARTSAGISVANLGVGGLQQSHVMLGRRNVGTSRQPHDLRSELDEADLDRHALKTLQGIVDVLHERRSLWRIRQGIGAVDVLDVRMPRPPPPPPPPKTKTTTLRSFFGKSSSLKLTLDKAIDKVIDAL